MKEKECKIEKRKGVKDISYVNSVILNEINREIFKNYQTVIREKVEEPIERVIEKFPGILQRDSIEDEINRKEAEMAEFTQKMTEKLSLLKSRTSQSIKKKPLCSKRLKVSNYFYHLRGFYMYYTGRSMVLKGDFPMEQSKNFKKLGTIGKIGCIIERPL